MKQHKPNCFEKTKVRWGIFKKLSPTKLHSEQSAPIAGNLPINAMRQHRRITETKQP